MAGENTSPSGVDLSAIQAGSIVQMGVTPWKKAPDYVVSKRLNPEPQLTYQNFALSRLCQCDTCLKAELA